MAPLPIPSPLPDWWLPLCRFRFGLVAERPKAPKPAPKWCLQEWDRFARWHGWKDAGGKQPRPEGLWKRTPQWAWQLRRELLAARVKPPPPPPPGPPSSWTLPGPWAFTAWGFQDHAESWPEELSDQCVEAGVGTILIQIGEADPAVADPFHRKGVKVALWGVAGSDDAAALDAFNAAGYVPQIEGPGQRDAALASLRASVGAGLSIAIVTTFSSLEDGATWFPQLAAAGANHLLVECYRSDGPNQGDVPRMMWQAKQYGWPLADPIVGLYGGVTLDQYDLTGQGRDWGWWLCEDTEPSDWPVIKTTGA